MLRGNGMVVVGWQARGCDAVCSDAQVIAARVVERALPGGVILLHDGAGLGGTSSRAPTLDALPRILDGLEARGLRFERLDRLLGVEPYRVMAS